MAKEKWNYGMLEIEFTQSDVPTYDDYMGLIENNLTETGTLEPLFSGSIAGRNEFWTFVRHRVDPKVMLEFCNRKLPNVKSYSHCYSFQRFRGELLPSIMREKHKYIGIADLPEAEEFNETELKDLMKKLEASTPFHVAWISKTHRPDRMNTYYFLTGNVEPEALGAQMGAINEHIKASKSEIHFIQKFAHHKSHRKSVNEKAKAIKDHMPEDYVDHEWLKEYDYYHWSR